MEPGFVPVPVPPSWDGVASLPSPELATGLTWESTWATASSDCKIAAPMAVPGPTVR